MTSSASRCTSPSTPSPTTPRPSPRTPPTSATSTATGSPTWSTTAACCSATSTPTASPVHRQQQRHPGADRRRPSTPPAWCRLHRQASGRTPPSRCSTAAPLGGALHRHRAVAGDAALVQDTSRARRLHRRDGVRVAIQKNTAELWSTTSARATTPPRHRPVSLDRGQQGRPAVLPRGSCSTAPTTRSPGTRGSPTTEGDTAPDRRQRTRRLPLPGIAGLHPGRPARHSAGPAERHPAPHRHLHKTAATSDDIDVEVTKNGQVITSSRSRRRTAAPVPDRTSTVAKRTASRCVSSRDRRSTSSTAGLDAEPVLPQLAGCQHGHRRRRQTADPAAPALRRRHVPDRRPHRAPAVLDGADDGDRHGAARPHRGGDTTDTVIFTVKRRGELVGQAHHQVTDGWALTSSYTITVIAGDKLYFDFTWPIPAGGQDQLQPPSRSPARPSGGASPARFTAPPPRALPAPYRGWCSFGYNGGRRGRRQPIVQGDLVIDADFRRPAARSGAILRSQARRVLASDPRTRKHGAAPTTRPGSGQARAAARARGMRSQRRCRRRAAARRAGGGPALPCHGCRDRRAGCR